MRTLFILSVIVFGFFSMSFGRTVSDVLSSAEIKRGRYVYKKGPLETLVIPVNFGSAVMLSTNEKTILKGANVLQIDLVFSDYPKGIDLENLNKQRIQKLLELRGDLVSDVRIRWNVIRQMDCKTESEAKLLFHGFVIHYTAEQNEELAAKEREFYQSFTDKISSGNTAKESIRQFYDTVVVAAFRRNKWFNATVVTDATGSMANYVGQFLLWHKLNLKANSKCNLVFFNDGDNMADRSKKIGSTGGIYTGTVTNSEELASLVLQAVKGGYGGDIQENGVEALLSAQKEFPNSKELIYIADNFAPLRDIELLRDVKIPVRVVVCGGGYGLNVHLFNLAMMTKGSYHTIEEDLKDLDKLLEGVPFKIGGVSYVLKEGKIITI